MAIKRIDIAEHDPAFRERMAEVITEVNRLTGVAAAVDDKLGASQMIADGELLDHLIETPDPGVEAAINAIINALTRSEPVPAVDTLVPADDADNVSASETTELTVKFDVSVALGAAVDIRLIATAGPTVVQQWTLADVPAGLIALDTDSVADDLLRLTLAEPMEIDTAYHVTIAEGSVVTARYGKPFAGISGATTWNFGVIGDA